MENFEIPFAITENLRHKRVQNYLCELNERLKQLRQQHDEIIEKSVSIMQEINEVTTSVDMVEIHLKSNANGIQELIQEFEVNACVKTQDDNEKYNKMLQDAKKHEDSEVLKESLAILKKTKGSLEKIESFLNKVVRETGGLKDETDKSNVSQQFGSQIKLSKSMDLAQFASCCSSAASMKAPPLKNNKKSITEQIFHDVSWSFTDIGYQGDLDDSECDLLAAEKKKLETILK